MPCCKVKESTFKRFLVDTPLLRKEIPASPDRQSVPWSFGTYHQQYWLDGKAEQTSSVIAILSSICLPSYWRNCASLRQKTLAVHQPRVWWSHERVAHLQVSLWRWQCWTSCPSA